MTAWTRRPFTIYLTVLLAATLAVAVYAALPMARQLPTGELPALHASLASIETVPQRQRILGYERQRFGNGWARAPGSPCTSREVAMGAGLERAKVPKSGLSSDAAACAPPATLFDPYTHSTLNLEDPATRVEVDHIFPLSAAWDLGAHQWDTPTRIAFANDPLNLVATAKEPNQDKSDKLPALWMPPHPGSRCWYATRLAAVAAKYDLRLSVGDTHVMRSACRLSFIHNYG